MAEKHMKTWGDPREVRRPPKAAYRNNPEGGPDAKGDRDPVIESLKERAWREIAAIDEALATGRINEEQWHEAVASLIRPAYLAADNPYAQAGHSGDAASWQSSRGFIAEALHASGSFLDVGCASGILMESVQHWGAEKNLTIAPYGLDIIPELVQLARQRLPQWADRIYVGNIRTWLPPRERFSFVLIRPEYAPETRRIDMIRHVLSEVLHPAGRLIIFAGTEEKECRSIEETVADSGFTVSGRIEVPHSKDSRVVRRLFWIDK
jgi:SAM-dependent methyltransferase